MKDYYQVLGLTDGADAKEIKRAYFKLVRKFTPEKDPERFREIREAYEILKEAAQDEENGALKLLFPDDPLAHRMHAQIADALKQRDYGQAIATAEAALSYCGECEGFLYLLGLSQREGGNTGKAVKTFERLNRLYPDRVEFCRELAISYMERGYGKKAYAAFGRAYEAGCRDLEFLLLYSHCCDNCIETKRMVALLEEAATIARKDPVKYVDEWLDSYAGLFSVGITLSDEVFCQKLSGFLECLRMLREKLAEYEDTVRMIVMILLQTVINKELASDASVRKQLEQIRQAAAWDGESELDESIWKCFEEEATIAAIEADKRLSSLMKRGYEAFTMEDEDPKIPRYAQLDTMLCILEEWPAIQDEIEIVRECYPVFYQYLEDFIHTLEAPENHELLQERLQKEYDRMCVYMRGGFYYKEHPDRRRSSGMTKWESEENGTYVRNERKVGRNDPCPCGSGKKYKKCCGRK